MQNGKRDLMIDREELIERHLLTEYVQDKGAKLKRNGKELVTNLCPVQEHKPGHLCVSISPEKQCWKCHDHDEGGSIIDWIMKESGKSLKTVMNELGGVSGPPEPPGVTTGRTEPGKATLEATYDYTDESGKLLYQVCRYKPKTFKQRQPDEFGGWIWGLEGITRVLFNLPSVLTAKEVFVVEGEKDAQALISMNYVATTSAGGAKNWLAAYGDTLKGKDVIIIPDSDEPGEEYAQAVIESLTDKANSVKRLRLPNKDTSDFVRGFADLQTAKAALDDLINRTPHAIAPLPLYSIGEMEQKYRKFVRGLKTKSLDLGKFMPGLGKLTRHLVPGELVLILSGTGTGKTALCQSICRSASPLPTLMFELELPLELMFERFVQMEVGCHGQDVEDDYKNNDDDYSDGWSDLKHVIVCPESGLTAAQIESYILRSELKFGKKPVLVCVDYIGLVKAQSRSRYEAVSENAEQMKVIAKRTGTIIVMTSQISRPHSGKEDLEVGLHDAKDSGSLENSAGLILGCWRPDTKTLVIKVLKNTKGRSGAKIECDFDGAKMQITERARKKGDPKPGQEQEEWDMD